MAVTRRDFLKAGVWGMAGLATLMHMKAHGAVTFKISACDWSLRVANTPDSLALAKDIGLDGVEISATGDVGETMEIADPALRQAYKSAMEETGLEISSVAMGCLNNYPFATDPRAPAWLEQTIEATADLGAKVILLAFFGKGDLRDSGGLLRRGGGLKEAEVDATVERLIAAAPIAEEAGVILGLENTLSAEENMAIVERVGHPAVQVYYDIGNSTYNGYDVPAEIRQLDALMCQIHFKDGGHALGEGRVDMDAVAAAMRDIQYSGWITLETAVLNDNVEASFRRNAAFIRTMFQQTQ